ncbi:MAG: NADPH-dependent 7-cyano-7-deazaguanine reductase QueF, partial [Proteobacteria bacterium]|nr:NADPH-dependent 7-cyano-7-deazaguanine reductase QueF [Pseudomonadota bacterium]
LPFYGIDVWNAYETSGLLQNGLPFTGVLKVLVPADSKYIVESKSFKLYLNSFNMTKLGNADAHYNYIESAVLELEDKVAADLSKLLETSVRCKLIINNDLIFSNVEAAPFEGVFLSLDQIYHFEDDVNEVDVYTETPELIKLKDNSRELYMQYYSGILKSNCRVTSQPDWGDVFITIKGPKIPTEESLLRYIVSFRDECHFHEEICETIYKRLWDICQPEELKVKCLYARRGGIDINPIRVSHLHLLQDEGILNLNEAHVKTPKQ